MDIKLLSLNGENEYFEYANWRHNMFEVPKRGRVLQLGGGIQLGGIR